MFPTGKVIFYIFNLALFTFTITKYAWSTQPPQKSGRFALRAIYLTKIISLALQAVQIRYSIPNKGTLYQQFLTSSVSRINFLAFRVYRALPFLHELRCVLDWSCTTTSLTMYDWLKVKRHSIQGFGFSCSMRVNLCWNFCGLNKPVMFTVSNFWVCCDSFLSSSDLNFVMCCFMTLWSYQFFHLVFEFLYLLEFLHFMIEGINVVQVKLLECIFCLSEIPVGFECVEVFMKAFPSIWTFYIISLHFVTKNMTFVVVTQKKKTFVSNSI